MKAKLQYYDDPLWFDCGTVRALDGNDYKVTAIIGRNSENDPECIGYKVTVVARILELDSGFLSSDQYSFKLKDLDSGDFINLSQRKYMVDYDGLIKRNDIEYHTIRLEFEIPIASYGSYTTWI